MSLNLLALGAANSNTKKEIEGVASGFKKAEKISESSFEITFVDGSSVVVEMPKGDKGDKGDTGEVAIKFSVIDVLPESGEPGCMYLLHKDEVTDKNIFDEYMWIDGAWELIGDTGTTVLDTYSTNEVVVGRWIDNKPVYRIVKTEIPLPTVTTDGTYVSSKVDVGVSNVDKIIKFEGNIHNPSGAAVYPSMWNTVSGTTGKVYMFKENNKLYASPMSSSKSLNGCFVDVIVEYTKTTD